MLGAVFVASVALSIAGGGDGSDRGIDMSRAEQLCDAIRAAATLKEATDLFERSPETDEDGLRLFSKVKAVCPHAYVLVMGGGGISRDPV